MQIDKEISYCISKIAFLACYRIFLTIHPNPMGCIQIHYTKTYKCLVMNNLYHMSVYEHTHTISQVKNRNSTMNACIKPSQTQAAFSTGHNNGPPILHDKMTHYQSSLFNSLCILVQNKSANSIPAFSKSTSLPICEFNEIYGYDKEIKRTSILCVIIVFTSTLQLLTKKTYVSFVIVSKFNISTHR